jgi:cobalt-zinc-cadmium efflux system protein
MTRESRLAIVFGLNAALIAGLIAVGLEAHSLGVFAAAGDYVADAFAIGLSLAAVRLSHRSATDRRSFGYHRTSILAAQVNASLVLAVSVLVSIEAVRRLFGNHGTVHGLPVVIVSAIAAAVMMLGALILHDEDDDDDLNMRAVLLDTAADAVTAAGVAATGVVILITGRYFWLDPTAALLIAVVIGYRAVRLLREVGEVLLESTPPGVDVSEVRRTISEDGDIEDVHDLHVWSLTRDVPLLSAHVVLAGHPTLEEAQAVVERAKARLLARFAIDHATLEMECEPCAAPDVHTKGRWPG